MKPSWKTLIAISFLFILWGTPQANAYTFPSGPDDSDLMNYNQTATNGGLSLVTSSGYLWGAWDNMFGNPVSGGDTSNFIFASGGGTPVGYQQYIVWNTGNNVTLGGFQLFLSSGLISESNMERSVDWFNLYVWDTSYTSPAGLPFSGEHWRPVAYYDFANPYDTDPYAWPGSPYESIKYYYSLPGTVTSNQFAAVFAQNLGGNNSGPRIVEFDFYGADAAVPLPPSALLLGSGLLGLGGYAWRRRST